MVVTVLMKTDGLASTFPEHVAQGPGLRGRNTLHHLRVWWPDQGSNPHGAIYWLCDNGKLSTISVPESPRLESKDNDGTHLRVVMVLRGVNSCKALSMAPSS